MAKKSNKKQISNSKRFLALFLSVLLCFSCFAFNFFSTAAQTFERQIEKFPESYKPALIRLHKAYPKWKFVAVKTNLDFMTAVSHETGAESVVSNRPAYSDMLKSKNYGDYNYDGGYYVTRDSSMVSANEFAIAHYMDPRNFLSVEGIFQFENLSFDSDTTVADVEKALTGTFMSNKNASYYDKKGNFVKSTTKFSTLIYNAGKKYNVDPCFIANKIINEVGVNGSGSSSGKNATYPGIYNYFNIGAYDGANAIEKGLYWASSGDTYSRPWTTPKKAIYGGTEFNAKFYINAGRYTNYFQKFNVSPTSSYSKYTHRYMTNVSGAAEIGYRLYLSYKKSNSLSEKHSFAIPVFEGMSNSTGSFGSLSSLDSLNRVGTLKTSSRIRKEASPYSDLLTTLSEGSKVTILEFVRSVTKYPEAFNMYPVWAKISFSQNGKKYTGYTYANFVNISTFTEVPVGSYTPIYSKSSPSLFYKYITTDARIATVSGRTINFKKQGTVLIYCFDSMGHFQITKYKVVSKTNKVSGIGASDVKPSSANVSFSKSDKYSSYNVAVLDNKNKLIKTVTTSKNSFFLDGLTELTNYRIYVCGISGDSRSPFSKGTFKTTYNTPEKPVISSISRTEDFKSVKISWSKANYAEGYAVFRLDKSSGKYLKIGESIGTSFIYLSDASAKGGTFKIKAFRTVDSKRVCSPYSSAFEYVPKTAKLSKMSFKASSDSPTQIKLSWSPVQYASEYRVYFFDENKGGFAYLGKTNKLSYTVSNLARDKLYRFKMRAVLSIYDTFIYGTYSDEVQTPTMLEKPTDVSTKIIDSSSVKFSWTPVRDASGYKICRYNYSTKKYETIYSTGNPNAKAKTILNLPSGKALKFRVKAFKTIDGVKYNSSSDYFKIVL